MLDCPFVQHVVQLVGRVDYVQDRVIALRGAQPDEIVLENGPELTSGAHS